MLERYASIALLLTIACDSDVDPSAAASSTASSVSGTGGAGPGSGGAGGSVGGGGSGGCPTLDEDTLAQLTFGIENDFAMQPGESRQLELGIVECCYFFEPVDVCAAFSIEPARGATIDASGLVQIDAATPPGSVFTVTASVEQGKKLVTAEIFVWTPESNPLAGTWTEVGQSPCPSGAEVPPPTPILELRFEPNGEFGVTWMPFELYVDYWGTYQIDLVTKALELTVVGGNYTPPDVDGAGTFTIDADGDLVLSEMWLGTPEGSTDPAGCGHRFE